MINILFSNSLITRVRKNNEIKRNRKYTPLLFCNAYDSNEQLL